MEFAECAAGQQLQRICRSFVTADGPTIDPWAARDANLRELPGGMSEIRIVGPTAEVEAVWNTMCRRADELHREEYEAPTRRSKPSPPSTVTWARTRWVATATSWCCTPARTH